MIPGRFGGGRGAFRTVVFWLMMIVLAAVLWQMGHDENKGSAHDTRVTSYSEFMANVDRSNIASAKLLESESTSEIEGSLRQPPSNFTATIPKEVIPSLMETLRKQGVPIEVHALKNARPLNVIMTIAPIILILIFWIFMMKNMRYRSPSAKDGRAASGPIGD